MDEQVSPAAVAEALWQAIKGINDASLKSHQAWVALPQAEKQPWIRRAESVIEDWNASRSTSVAQGWSAYHARMDLDEQTGVIPGT